MFKPLNIKFDLDGVLGNFASTFEEYAELEFGIKFYPAPQFHWKTEPKVTPELFSRLIEEFIIHQWKTIPEWPGARDVLKYLRRRSLDPIDVVTSRKPSTAAATHMWLLNMFPTVPFRVSVIGSYSKLPYIHDTDCFVDDRRKTAIHLANRGKVVFMPMREYNMPISGSSGETLRSEIPVFFPSDWKEWEFEGKFHKTMLESGQRGALILLEEVSDLRVSYNKYSSIGKFDFLMFK